MGRLIDANNLYRIIDGMKLSCGALGESDYMRGFNHALNDVKSLLHNKRATPTIDPKSPRPRGNK